MRPGLLATNWPIAMPMVLPTGTPWKMFLVGGEEIAGFAACAITQGMPDSTTIGLIAIATALHELPCSMKTLSW